MTSNKLLFERRSLIAVRGYPRTGAEETSVGSAARVSAHTPRERFNETIIIYIRFFFFFGRIFYLHTLRALCKRRGLIFLFVHKRNTHTHTHVCVSVNDTEKRAVYYFSCDDVWTSFFFFETRFLSFSPSTTQNRSPSCNDGRFENCTIPKKQPSHQKSVFVMCLLFDGKTSSTISRLLSNRLTQWTKK